MKKRANGWTCDCLDHAGMPNHVLLNKLQLFAKYAPTNKLPENKTNPLHKKKKNRNRQEFNSSSPSKQVKDFEKQINETRNTTKMRFIKIQTTPYPPFNIYRASTLADSPLQQLPAFGFLGAFENDHAHA